MGDLERQEVFQQISEELDNIDEIIENNDIDVDDDEQFSEIVDLLSQVRNIMAEE